MSSRQRRFLFLQGVCSPFFAALADHLEATGHAVARINFNVGDCLYWGRRAARAFREPLSTLPEYLEQLYRQEGITDQILFGDRRPIHRPAIERAPSFGVRTHVFEEGYFRPWWVTLEREGVNAHSLLPRDPAWYRRVGARLAGADAAKNFASPFSLRAAHDVAYHCASFWNPLFFPRYRTHAPVNAAIEYAGYARRLPSLRWHARRDNRVIDALLAAPAPYYLLPLQLGSDAQIRDHSPFADMAEVMAHVLTSFAAHAPGEAQLVIKNHPLDLGLDGHARTLARLAAHHGLTGRVHYLETGDLDRLLRRAKGTVTVNSTVGGQSLGADCPTHCLSNPIYHLPGLTFQGSLDDFWRRGEAPDAALFQAFRRTVLHATQVNGGFYSKSAIALAVAGSAPMLLAGRSPLETLL